MIFSVARITRSGSSPRQRGSLNVSQSPSSVWTDFSEGPVKGHVIWGGNMAVRAAVFREHKFAEGVEMGSETEFIMRTEGSGHRCWH